MNLSKKLTIQGTAENKPTITFTDKGIALWGKALTFTNCNVEMKGIGSTPYTRSGTGKLFVQAGMLPLLWMEQL